jgi:hypothetical protein
LIRWCGVPDQLSPTRQMGRGWDRLDLLSGGERVVTVP